MSNSKHDSRPTSQSTPANTAPVPRDARLIALILASMGIEDTEPAVLIQLMEFARRTSDYMTDSRLHKPSITGCVSVC